MRSRRLALVLLSVAASSGCRRSLAQPDATPPSPDATGSLAGEVIRFDSMAVEAGAWPDGSGVRPPERALAHHVWEMLATSLLFDDPHRHAALPDGANLRHARLRIAYAVDVSDDDSRAGERVVRAAATLVVDWAVVTDVDLAENVSCDARLAAGEPLDGTPERLVTCALERGALGVVAMVQLRHADAAAIIAALDSEDPSLRALAFSLVGERGVTAAVPKLLTLLHSPDPLTRDGAIGALIALREPRAVKPITELAPFSDLDMMRRIVDAVGAIGGDEARAYLELVASGHQVAAIREQATQALSHLGRDAGR